MVMCVTTQREYDELIAYLRTLPGCKSVTEVRSTTVAMLPTVPTRLQSLARNRRVPPPLPEGWSVDWDAWAETT